MSAPGNSALIFTLLALFLACSGYAAGRVHQRYRTDEDREEAYRHGYDTASRSVFSLAARIIAPRRSAGRGAVSGSAKVRNGLGELTTRSLQALRVSGAKPATAAAAGSVAPAGSVAAAGSAAAGPAAGSATGSAVAGSAVAGPLARAGSVAPGEAVATAGPGAVSSDLGIFARVAGSGGSWLSAAGPGPAGAGAAGVAGAGVAWLGAVGPAAAESGSQGSGASLPGAPPRVPLVTGFGELGFPVPPPPSPNTVAEPAAVGGVTFQPFPDPRPAGGFGPVPAFADEEPAPARRPSATRPRTDPARPVPSPRLDRNVSDGNPASAVGHRAADGEPAPDPDPADSPGGRHTVPDELVRAATYRLPPDRVFRAKVRDTAAKPAATPEDPAARRSVPKPRQS